MASSTGSGGVLAGENNADIAAVNPVITVYGSIIPLSYGQRIWHTSGVQPGKATIWLGGATPDATGPVTLNKSAFGIKRFDPVTISDGAKVLFNGLMLERLDQGENNVCMWEAHDWRWLLQGIPVTGCFMYDEVRDAIYYNRRASCHMNPGGRWNCIVHAGQPVFTHIASEQVESGDLGEVLYDATDKDGYVCPWTPARAIKYLTYCANLERSDISSNDVPAWRSLKKSSYLKFPESAADIAGVDDAYYAIMPDTSIEAKSMAGALDTLIKLAGVIDLRATYETNTTTLSFFATKLSSDQAAQVGAAVIPLARGGTAADANTAFDFDLRESGIRQFGAAAINGAPVRIETSLTYDPDDVANSTLSDASSESERTAWAKIVNGGSSGGKQYAYRPSSIPANGDWDSGDITWALTDGTGTLPLIYANSNDAVRLARSFLRRPWRSFKINVDMLKTNNIHKGVNGAFDGENFLETPRPVLLEQLQRLVSEYNDGSMKARCPISVTIDGKPVLANDGLMVDDDGTLVFAGLTEESGAGTDSVYGNTLRYPDNLALREVKINLAFPHDFRSVGYAAKSGMEAIASEIEGPPLYMVDGGDSYPIEHQVNSRPLPHLTSVPATTGSGGVSAPVTRVLRDESARANKAAERMLAEHGEPEITSQWSMIGIRADYGVGTWIEKVKVSGGVDDSDYPIGAPLKTILYDFENQVTVFGGFLHSNVRLTAAKPPAAKAKQPEQQTQTTAPRPAERRYLSSDQRPRGTISTGEEMEAYRQRYLDRVADGGITGINQSGLSQDGLERDRADGDHGHGIYTGNRLAERNSAPHHQGIRKQADRPTHPSIATGDDARANRQQYLDGIASGGNPRIRPLADRNPVDRPTHPSINPQKRAQTPQTAPVPESETTMDDSIQRVLRQMTRPSSPSQSQPKRKRPVEMDE